MAIKIIEEWHREHNLPSKTFLVNHEFGEDIVGDSANEENYINPEIELDVEQQSNTDMYHQVASTLKGYRKLSGV